MVEMLLNIAVNPEELIIKGVDNPFIIGDVMRASCEAARIRPVPLAMYWLYNGTRVHRGRIFSQMNVDMEDYNIISMFYLNITEKDQGSSLMCVVETECGKQLRSKRSIILTNMINSK